MKYSNKIIIREVARLSAIYITILIQHNTYYYLPLLKLS